MFLAIGIFMFFCFLGFASGRYGDKWGGHLNAPDHWIYGIIATFLGLFYFEAYTLQLVAFGIGHFVSDLDDFLVLKFYGPDKQHDWRFWSTK